MTPLFTSPKNCDYCGAHPTQHHDSWCQATPEGAVGVIGADWTLRWIGTGPISPIIEKHGLKVGTKLYTHPTPAASPAGVPDDVEASLTAAMREADKTFGRVGGSTRHYVRDCLLPILEKRGLRLTSAAPSAPEGDGGEW